MLKTINLGTDNREIEFVIPVKNEELRIEGIIKNLISSFKVTILDGASSDKTVEIAKAYNCDIYLREFNVNELELTELGKQIYIAQNGTSHAIAYYINNISRSKLILRLWCDELISKENKVRILENKNEDIIFIAKRYDWFYGTRLNTPAAYYPFSFKPGGALWDDKVLHSDLINIDKNNTRKIYIDIEHFNIFNIAENTGKLGVYTKTDVMQIIYENKFTNLKIIYRFGIMLLSNFKHFRKWPSLGLFIAAILLRLIDMVMGILIFHEVKNLPSIEMQRKIRDNYISNNS